MKNLLKFCLILVFSNALIFIFNHPNIYFWDDFEHLLDVETYLKFGINLKSLLLHGNESGILTYWFWTILGNVFGDNITVYRLGNWTIFVVFCSILINFTAKETIKKEPILFSILFLLSSIFSSMISALVLTEACSLLIGLLTFLCFQKYLISIDSKRYYWLFAATILMGLSIITRFYLITLLGTIGSILLLEHFLKFNFKLLLIQFFAILIGLLPFLLLIYYWEGLVPPVFKTRYPTFISEVGFNFKRPLAAIIYIGLWSSPIIFLGISFKKIAIKKNLLILACCFFLFFILIFNNFYLWNVKIEEPIGTGIFDFLIKKAYNFNTIFGVLLNAFLSGIGLFFSILFMKELCLNDLKIECLNIRKSQFKIEIFLFFYIIFYVLEQLFVSGNVPFYERYMVLIYPALGYLLFQFLMEKQINLKVKIYILISVLLSCLNLWRIQ